MRIFIDFETRSRIDLKKAGVTRYAQDKSTSVLCLCYAIGNGEVNLWYPGLPAPYEVFDNMSNYYVSGFNVYFELQIWKYVCNARMKWPELLPSRCTDTMSDALALALPGSLEETAIALNVINKKDPVGKKLIQKLCKPISAGKRKGEFREKEEFQADYINLYRYCAQDVRTERDVFNALPLHATEEGNPERDVWLSTVASNRRGVPIDTVLVHSVISRIGDKLDEHNKELQKITNNTVRTATQREAVRSLLEEKYKIDCPNLQNTTVDSLLKDFENGRYTDPDAKRILEIRRSVNHPSTAKFKRILLQLCDDNTVKDNIRYHGAATGRDTASGFQLQNLPRLSVDDPEMVIESFIKLPIDALDLLYGDTIEIASALIRPAICAPDGMKFFNSDLSQVEARKTAWVAGETEILDAYRRGLDAYKVAAAAMFKTKYELISKDERQAGKIAVLACGFAGGYKALLGMAANYGIVFEDDEAKEIVNKFRQARPKLVATWAAFEDAAINAVCNPGTMYFTGEDRRFAFKCVRNFLFMSGPSGRVFSFPFPRYEVVTTPWGPRKMITHMWMSSYTRKWERRSISGASMMQSMVQGLSRDILMEANLRLEFNGYNIIFRVHDELTGLVPDDPSYSLEHFNNLFKQNPSWCLDLPLDSDPWSGKRYRK